MARLSLVTPRGAYRDLTLGLRGRHQVANALAAVRLLEEVSAHGLMPVPADAIRTAVHDVKWPARLELLRWRRHDVIIDGAHNPAGARALAAYLDGNLRPQAAARGRGDARQEAGRAARGARAGGVALFLHGAGQRARRDV